MSDCKKCGKPLVDGFASAGECHRCMDRSRQPMYTEELIAKLVTVTRDFNDKRIPRKKRDALIPIADAIRAELARNGRTVSVEEMSRLITNLTDDR